MIIDIMTLFPEMCESFLFESIMGRAIKKGAVQICCHQIRDFAYDKHRRVDDTPYGGGKGMLMMAEPIYKCFEHICSIRGTTPWVIYMSPKGGVLSQETARNLTKKSHITILCGHYEGVDRRIIDEIADQEISIGNYVVTGGELPALILTDAVCRMIPGVLSSNICFEEESYYSGMLEHPQYTKPALWHNRKVPDVLLSGHHANIENWKKEQSLSETLKQRKKREMP